MKDKIIISVVAEKGGGKGFFADAVKRLLPEKKVTSIRFSDPLVQILSILDMEVSRKNIDTLVTAFRSAFGREDILVDAVWKQVETADAGVVVLDGVRKRGEADFVKKHGGYIVYVSVRPEIRFERRTRNPEKKDEVQITFEEFIAHDSLPSNRSVREVGETMADAIIDNNGTREAFEQQIEAFLKDRRIV